MKQIILVLLLSMGISSAMAQDVYSSSGRPLGDRRRTEERTGFDPSRVIWGGGLSFGLGNGFLNVGVLPILGYKVSEHFAAGIGIGYNYLRIKDAYRIINAQGIEESRTFNTSTYNVNAWARYLVWNNIFVQVQPELNSLDVIGVDTVFTPTHAYFEPVGNRTVIASVLVGAGIRQQITERVSFVPMILYDVLQEKNSPYPNIDIRFGINIGF